MRTWRWHRAHRNSRASSIAPPGEEGWTIRLHPVILHSEPYASADPGAASDVTAKSMQSGAASASSPTPIQLQPCRDVIADTRGDGVLRPATSGQAGNNSKTQVGSPERLRACSPSSGIFSSGGLFAESPRLDAATNIEGFNAALRPYLYVHKGATKRARAASGTQGFLDLFRAWFNLRTRRWGRHKGTSAHECLTRQRVRDWLTLLGYPPSPTLN